MEGQIYLLWYPHVERPETTNVFHPWQDCWRLYRVPSNTDARSSRPLKFLFLHREVIIEAAAELGLDLDATSKHYRREFISKMEQIGRALKMVYPVDFATNQEFYLTPGAQTDYTEERTRPDGLPSKFQKQRGFFNESKTGYGSVRSRRSKYRAATLDLIK